MALFTQKSETKKTPAKPAVVKTVATKTAASMVGVAKNVIIRPRITEKAANLSSDNVYVFEIRKEATKTEVANAIQALYKVKPVKVNVVNTCARRVRLRRTRGFGKTASFRKAYVFLKKGDTIALA